MIIAARRLQAVARTELRMTRAQLEHIFWRGVDVDYDALQTTGERVRQVLAGGKEVHLTHPNGTDLTLRVAGRPVFVSGGVISAEDEQRGGPATLTMTAGSDMAALQAFYNAAPAGKDELGVLDIGINSNVEIPEGTTLAAWMPAGMVTVSLGSNDWAGGTNQAVSGVSPFLAGTTLTVDGVPLVKAGRLQIATSTATR